MMQKAGSRLKNRQTPRHENVYKAVVYHLLANIFARTEQKIELFCKRKDRDLSF